MEGDQNRKLAGLPLALDRVVPLCYYASGMKMSWEYIAGYTDGEGCLLLGVTRDKREQSTKGSQVDGWIIQPTFQITSFDYETLDAIQEFLIKEGFDARKYKYPRKRYYQLSRVQRLSVFGWKRLVPLAEKFIPLTIVKRRQFELFLELAKIVNSKQVSKKKRSKSGVWTKDLFIKAMEKVDEINALKSGKRGNYNADYFRKLWSM